MSEEIVVTPLTASIGARFEGVDLRKEIPDGVAQQIREAFCEHQVLVFPDPDGVAGNEEQTRLAALFGEPGQLPVIRFLGDLGKYTELDPRLSGGKPDPKLLEDNAGRARVQPDPRTREFEGWHSDSTYMPELPRVATIRAELIPPVGGDTAFASLCAAYAGLSPVWQEWLQGLKAVHMVPWGYKAAINVWQYGDDAEERFDAQYPPREHPIVIKHPDTGRPALFVNPSYVVSVADMNRQESYHLLRFLYTHITSSRFIYRHHWYPGDIVLWDEVTCLHLAPVDFAPYDRKTVRITSGLAKPTAVRD